MPIPGRSSPSASVSDWFWRGPGRAWGLWERADGSRSLVVEEHEGGRRVVRRYLGAPDALRCVEETVFVLGPAGFSELERRRARREPNRIAAPFTLPPVLALGARYPAGGGEVCVEWIGACVLGDLQVVGLCLRATVSGEGGRLWLVRGIGEVVVEGVERLVAWRSADGATFAGEPGERWVHAPLPDLPPWDGRVAPAQGLLR